MTTRQLPLLTMPLPLGYMDVGEEQVPTVASVDLLEGGEVRYLRTYKWLDRKNDTIKAIHFFQLLSYTAGYRFALHGSEVLDSKMDRVSSGETVFLRYDGASARSDVSAAPLHAWTVARAVNGQPRGKVLMLDIHPMAAPAPEFTTERMPTAARQSA